MKKSTLYYTIAATAMVSAIPATASAAITGLNSISGVYSCNLDIGTAPNGCSYGTNVPTGSWFAMDFNGDGTIQNGEKTILTELATMNFADTTPAEGSHAGSIDGSEGAVFDIWEFMANTGMNFLTTPIVDNGDGTLDMSGWTVTWNGIPAIPVGGDASQGDTSLATIACGACNNGDVFALDYAAHVPLGDPSGFGGILYGLHLEGTVVSSVPVPAAVWLFGSGLLGLAGAARRKSRL